MDTKRLVEERKKLGLSVREIAPLIGVTYVTYCRAETGKSELKAKPLVKFQKLTGMSDADMWRMWAYGRTDE